jgi:hypothetical protein
MCFFQNTMAKEPWSSSERIPRRPAPEFEHADSLGHAISRDGFFGTAFDDKNQYGPIAMMILLLIVATITGGIMNLIMRL